MIDRTFPTNVATLQRLTQRLPSFDEHGAYHDVIDVDVLAADATDIYGTASDDAQWVKVDHCQCVDRGLRLFYLFIFIFYFFYLRSRRGYGGCSHRAGREASKKKRPAVGSQVPELYL